MASFISKSITGQNESCGDGKISAILLISEILNNCDQYIRDGYHPSQIAEGLDNLVEHLDSYLLSKSVKKNTDYAFLLKMARNFLGTKLNEEILERISTICAQTVDYVRENENDFDATMVETLKFQSGDALESELIRGLVLDHGGRHSNMPKRLENVGVLLLNISLEYEKTEINSSILFSTAAQKEALANSEREFVEKRAIKIIDFLKSCTQFSSFLIINQKGIEPVALDLFAKAGILALRRAKRRNIDRILRLCGGSMYSSLDDIHADGIGKAGLVYEKSLGDEKYTFIEDTPISKSCTILLRGSSDHCLKLLHDSTKSTLKTLGELIKDSRVVPGAAAMYSGMAESLKNIEINSDISAASAAILSSSLQNIFKNLFINAGAPRGTLHDKMSTIMKSGKSDSLSMDDFSIIDPIDHDLLDSYHTISSTLKRAISVSKTLLMIDEVLRAGKSVKKDEQ